MTAQDPLSRSGLRGREAELEALQALIDVVLRTGGSGLALVHGEPGIGKTTLLGEALARAGAAGFSVGSGKADELHSMVPLSSLAAFAVNGDRPLMSGEVVVDLARHHDQRIWLVECVAEAIEARAASGPVLVALDDVQWADPLSRLALKQLPTRLATSPVLWILASREDPAGLADEIVASAAGSVLTVDVPLGPLSSAAIGQLAGDSLGAAVDERVRGLLAGAGGNPFLAVEMLAGLGTAEVSNELVPPGLVVGVRGRLRSLQPGTLRFLQMGAVLGRSFAFHDAAALCGEPTTALIPALEEAVCAGLLDDDGDQLVFRHDLLRQAVYVDISPSARKALHREAARHLARTGRQPIDVVPHILRGAVPGDEEAATLLRCAADDVLSVEPSLAADLMTRALELVPTTQPLWFEVGEQTIVCLSRAGRNREAVTTGERLLAGRPPLEAFSRLQAVIGTALWNMDLADDLRRRMETTLTIGGATPEVTAKLTALHALALSRGADLGAARDAGQTALRAATAIRDREAHLLALSGLGEIEQNAGENSAALEYFSALAALDPAFLPEEIVARLHLDDFASADRLLLQASEAAGPSRQAMMLWARGQYDLALGRLDDADAGFSTMERLEDEVQVPVHQVNGRVIRSWIALLRGDQQTAREHLAAAQERLAIKPNPGNTAVVRFLEGVHAEADGDLELAIESIRRVQHEGPFMRWRLLRNWVVFAIQVSLRGADRDLAEDLAAQTGAYADRNPTVPTAKGIAAQAVGLVTKDLGMLAQSVELLEASPRPLMRAAAYVDLGRALLAESQKPQALTALTRARDLFAESGAHAVAARVQRDADAAQGGSRRSPATQRPVQGWGALTTTEKKVARLIAEGNTNRTAADLLVVSPHTVNTHLTSVFRKLSVNSRVQLANLVMALPDS
ncbi:MAG: AAA family ATPase [Catenulispora sp.]|nr:AAA family ATPase [Catenulispora sp.]